MPRKRALTFDHGTFLKRIGKPENQLGSTGTNSPFFPRAMLPMRCSMSRLAM